MIASIWHFAFGYYNPVLHERGNKQKDFHEALYNTQNWRSIINKSVALFRGAAYG